MYQVRNIGIAKIVRYSVFYLLSYFCLCVPSYAEPDYSKVPVFFVHGSGMTAGSWDTAISDLIASGYPASYLQAIQLEPSNGANIPAAEQQIAPAIEQFLQTINAFLTQEYPSIALKTRVDLISHSMGGLSSRWYTAKLRPDRVRTWISLAGANHGTNDLCPYSDPGADDSCPAYAKNEQESYIQYQLNGAPDLGDTDETPYGIGQDSTGVTAIPPDQNRRVFYVTIGAPEDDVWIDPDDSVILDGAGGIEISIPVDKVEVISPGNLRMKNPVSHDGLLSDSVTINVVKLILAIAEYPLTLTTEGQGTVALSPPGGIYVAGTEVSLMATPASGWQFSGWRGDLNGTENPTTLRMDSKKSVTAIFQKADNEEGFPWELFYPAFIRRK